MAAKKIKRKSVLVSATGFFRSALTARIKRTKARMLKDVKLLKALETELKKLG